MPCDRTASVVLSLNFQTRSVPTSRCTTVSLFVESCYVDLMGLTPLHLIFECKKQDQDWPQKAYEKKNCICARISLQTQKNGQL